MIGRAIFAGSLLLAALSPIPALAASAVNLKGDVKVMRTVIEAGVKRDVLEAPTKVVPGDKLVFSTNYANETGQAVNDFIVTNPLPAAVALAEDGDFDVSVDGGKTWGRFATRTVTEATGVRKATLSDVTHIRWTLPQLKPGATGKVTYLAVVR